jgi:hypothetical protein
MMSSSRAPNPQFLRPATPMCEICTMVPARRATSSASATALMTLKLYPRMCDV